MSTKQDQNPYIKCNDSPSEEPDEGKFKVQLCERVHSSLLNVEDYLYKVKHTHNYTWAQKQ